MTAPNRPQHRTLADYIAWCQADEAGDTVRPAPVGPASQGAVSQADFDCGSQGSLAPACSSTEVDDTVFAPLAAHLAAPLHRTLAYWRLRTTDVSGFVPELERVSRTLVREWMQTGALRPLAPCTDPAVPEVADWRLGWAFHEHAPAATAGSLDMESLYIRRALRPVFVAAVNAGGSAEGFVRFATRQGQQLLEAYLGAPDAYTFLLRTPPEPARASGSASYR